MATREPHVLKHLAFTTEWNGLRQILDAENTSPICRYSSSINITNQECSAVIDWRTWKRPRPEQLVTESREHVSCENWRCMSLNWDPETHRLRDLQSNIRVSWTLSYSSQTDYREMNAETCLVAWSSLPSSDSLSEIKREYCLTKRCIGAALGIYVLSIWFALSLLCVLVIPAQNVSAKYGFAHIDLCEKARVMNWFSWRLYSATNPHHRSSNSSSFTKSSNKAWNFFLKVQFFEYTAPNISFALLSTCHLHQRCRVRGISDDIAFHMAWHWSVKFIKKCNDYKTVKEKQETLL